MTTNTTAPLTAGDRVTRRYDGAVGTVESVRPLPDGGWGIAVRLDKDGEVWSGTEVAWTLVPDTDCPHADTHGTTATACTWCDFDPMASRCGAAYAPPYAYACDLAPGHKGNHEDHHSDAPHTLAWTEA